MPQKRPQPPLPAEQRWRRCRFPHRWPPKSPTWSLQSPPAATQTTTPTPTTYRRRQQHRCPCRPHQNPPPGRRTQLLLLPPPTRRSARRTRWRVCHLPACDSPAGSSNTRCRTETGTVLCGMDGVDMDGFLLLSLVGFGVFIHERCKPSAMGVVVLVMSVTMSIELRRNEFKP